MEQKRTVYKRIFTLAFGVLFALILFLSFALPHSTRGGQVWLSAENGSMIHTPSAEEDVLEAVSFFDSDSVSAPDGTDGLKVLALPAGSPVDLFTARVVEIACAEPEVAEDAKRNTKYGAYFGDPGSEWCTEFVVWCVLQAKVSVEADGLTSFDAFYPRITWSGGCIEWYSKRGFYYPKGTLLPRRGDMIFFDTDHDGISDHTGLVTGTEYDGDDGTYYVLTVEGNIPGDRPSDKIRQRRFPLDAREIVWYGTFYPDE